MLDDLAAIRAASVIVPAEVGDRDQPIDDPFLTIETTADLPRSSGEPARRMSASLVIDDQATVDGLTNAIATRSLGEQIHALQVRLDPQAFPALPADIGSLLDPVPLPIPFSDAAKATIAFSTITEFRRSLDGWSKASGLDSDPEKDWTPLDPEQSRRAAVHIQHAQRAESPRQARIAIHRRAAARDHRGTDFRRQSDPTRLRLRRRSRTDQCP